MERKQQVVAAKPGAILGSNICAVLHGEERLYGIIIIKYLMVIRVFIVNIDIKCNLTSFFACILVQLIMEEIYLLLKASTLGLIERYYQVKEENNESETVSSSQRESGSTTSLTDDETSRRNDVHNHQQSPLSASSSALSEQCSTSPRLMVVDDSSCSESVFTIKR